MQTLTAPRAHVWTRRIYAQLIALGIFDAQHVELIEGHILDMTPMGSLHATAVALTANVLEQAFGTGYFVRWQMPFGIGELSEPEPDVAVVQGNIRDHVNAHPTTAALIVEISDTSLDFDRTQKAGLYATAGVADYWIVNLIARHLEILRDPVSDQDTPYGFSYRLRDTKRIDEDVSPLALPHLSINVVDLMP